MRRLCPTILTILCGLLVIIAQARADYNSLRKAYDQLDLPKAKLLLATMYRDGNSVDANIDKAVFWYLEAASVGMPEAQVAIGLFYHRGEGVKRNHTQALYWFRKAADQKSPDGENNLGTMYDLGQGVTQDHAQAAYWYHRAAKQNSPDAQFNLGALYEYGLGVAKDVKHAYILYAQSAFNFPYENLRIRAKNARDRTARKTGEIELAKLVVKVDGPAKETATVQKKTGKGNKRTTDTNSDFTELSIASNNVDTPQDIGRLVQYPLSILGYKPGPIDQQLGPKTQIAIRAFQADSNLAVTGQSDKQLVIELMGAMLKHWSSETDTRSHFRF